MSSLWRQHFCRSLPYSIRGPPGREKSHRYRGAFRGLGDPAVREAPPGTAHTRGAQLVGGKGGRSGEGISRVAARLPSFSSTYG
jgi:hypothetical protein